MIRILFDIPKVDKIRPSRHYTYTNWGSNGRLIYDDGFDGYLDYLIHLIQPALDWCNEEGITVKIEQGNHAMQVTLIFENQEDALAFKLRWEEKMT